jgi:hypothetical protein
LWSPLWSHRLRQGDIFGLIDYPSAKAGISRGTSPPGAPVHTKIDKPNMAIMVSSPRYALVISHDCDFNEGKRDFFLAASIHELDRRDRKPERLEKLRRDNNARSHTPANQIALKGFLLEPVPGHFEEPMLALFETITPIAMKFKVDMLKLKRAEMNHAHRVMLREKLMLFAGRQEDDIPDNLKASPPDDAADLEWRDVKVGT